MSKAEKSIKEVGSIATKMSVEALLLKAMRQGAKVPHDIVAPLLDGFHIKPVFLQKENPDFSRMREKLNTEAGVLIANHPGSGDVFLLMDLLTRTDILFLVGQGASARYSDAMKVIDTEHFLFATQSASLLRAQFKKIQEHIQQGGLFIIFPTGGNSTGLEGFKSGFKFLVEKVLAPEQMVYACHFSEGDIKKMKQSQNTRIVEVLFNESVGGSPFISNDIQEVLVNEMYTTADSWKKSIEHIPHTNANTALQAHFDSLFKK